MLWGSFGVVHIISLVLVALINICLYFILKNKRDIIKKTVKMLIFLLKLKNYTLRAIEIPKKIGYNYGD